MTDTSATRPDIDPILKMLLDAVPLEFTIDDGVDVAREKLRALKPPAELLPDMRIEERTVDFGELTDVPVRIYWPPIDAHDHLPIVVFYHGGGWSIGDLDTHDHVARAHAVSAEAIVVSVDYRLAPEHPFPEGVEDAWAALRWVGEHAAELGGDPARIAVAGDSAGGNLADAPILSPDVVAAFLAWYLPDVDMSDPTALSTDLAPANAKSLAGLPPAYIGTAEHDPLRDDGGKYAELLAAGGVSVVLSNEPTMAHGFISLALAVPAAAEATDRGLAALKAALHPTR